MAIIKPTFSLTANSSSSTTNPGPFSSTLSLDVTDLLSIDLVDHFTYDNVRTTYQATNFDKKAPLGQVLVKGNDFTQAAKSDGTTLTHNGCYIYIMNTSPSTSKHIIAIGHTLHGDIDDDSATVGPIATSGTGGGAVDADSDNDLTPIVEENTDKRAEENKRLFSLRAGEFAFFPYDYTGMLYCQATGASQSLEFWRFDRT